MKRALAACVAAACGAPPTGRALLANRSPAPLPDDAFSTRALAGPYRTLADYCADAARRAQEQAGDDERDEPVAPLGCQHGAAFVDAGPTHAGDASLVPFRAADDGDGTRCALVLAVAGKLWVDEDAMPCRPDDGRSRYERIAVDELAWRDAVAESPGPELELAVSISRWTAGDTHTIDQQLTICGVGPSGRPRCTPPIPTSADAISAFATHPRIARDGTLTFALDVTRDEGTVDDDYLADFRRSYALRFP